MNYIFTFSIIIPARNERKNLEKLIPELYNVLKTNMMISKFEIIVLNHNSQDDSQECLNQMQFNELKIIEINDTKIGLGEAVKIGFQQASYDFIITMDGDQSHPAIFVKEFIQAGAEGHDVIIGGRYMKNQEHFEPLSRYRISKIFNFLPRMIINKSISDYTTGFRCFKRDLLNRINIDSKNFSYHLEINIKLIKNAINLKEIPIRYEKRTEGQSKLKYRKEFWGYMRVLIKCIFLEKRVLL